MAKGVFDNMSAATPKNHFSVGIIDDVTNNSVSYDESFKLDDPAVLSAVFYGLGSDGTVGANKNTIKIIGHETPNFAQAYFVYDSKKSGGITVSHLRFGPNPIRAPYLVRHAQFVGCHQFSFMQKYRVLRLRGGRRGIPAQLNLRRQNRLEPPQPRGSTDDYRQEAQILRHRRHTASPKGDGHWAAESTR